MSHHLWDQLVLLPVILPLLGAGLCLAFGRSAPAQRLISVVVLTVVVAVAGTLLWRADAYGPQSVNVGGWSADIGISLVADRLSALLLVVSTIVTLSVLLYSFGQGIVEFGRDAPLSVFHPTFLVLSAGVSAAFLSADLFNLFVGFEILLAASFVLITLGGTEARVRSGTIYVIVSLISSFLFLISIAAVYAAVGTVNLAALPERIAELPEPVQLVLQLMILVTFSIKAAVFPLSAWLPDSYPTAPAPVTAVFAGLLTKVGVYAIIRVQTTVFPDQPLSDLLMVVAILTMVIGILGAVAQSDIKRLLSFTLVSHIGYMLFGIALATEAGYAGAIFYVVHHITVQTALFLVAGLIEYRTGTTQLDRLGGLARATPILAVLFFIPAMNLAGVPPFSGFLGKLALIQAGAATGELLVYGGVAAGLATSLLTLYAVAKAWNRAFWQPLDDDIEYGSPTSAALHPTIATADTVSRLPRGMALPTLGLVVFSLTLSVAAGPLVSLSQRAASELADQSAYTEAVLGETP
ncbi:MAG: Na+/H+ antiporter subunit D [Aeromicrobium sp.]|uniref:Na+/H+ antiporter subunit D n=1 Tax=Aeromicrobium sp. TaxID=1871063 RepID=UPI0039E34E02